MGVGGQKREGGSFAFKGSTPGLAIKALKKCVFGKLSVLHYGARKRRGIAKVGGDSSLQCQLCPSAGRGK